MQAVAKEKELGRVLPMNANSRTRTFGRGCPAWPGTLVLVLALFASADAAAPAYSPGLGDNQNTLHWLGPCFRYEPAGEGVKTTFDQAKTMYERVYNFTNGTHQATFPFGWEKGQGCRCPFFDEDTVPPFDNGFQKMRGLRTHGYRYNVDTGLYLDSPLTGPHAYDLIPDKDKGLDPKGKWKAAWKDQLGRPYRVLSIRNRIDNGSEWKLLNGFVDNFECCYAVFEDFFSPSTADFTNQDPSRGGAVTTKAEEWAAVLEEIDYLWHKLNIGVHTEVADVRYAGHVFAIHGGYGGEDPKDYMDNWGNATLFFHRTNRNIAMDLAFGSEWGPRYETRSYVFGERDLPNQLGSLPDLRAMYYRHAVAYFYMQKFDFRSYGNNANRTEVKFSGDLVSLYDKATRVYTLKREFPDRTVLFADGIVESCDVTKDASSDYCRFVPQVGAGCKIIAYSKTARPGANWILPPEWDGVASIDRYVATMEQAPVKLDTLSVAAKSVVFDMEADTGYVLVPAGDAATPVTVTFNELKPGAAVTSYAGIGWHAPGHCQIKVEPPQSAAGLSTNSIFVDNDATAGVAIRIVLPAKGILHSLRIGTLAGEGTVELRSSARGNAAVVRTLPRPAETALVETDWQFAETGAASITITNGAGCRGTLVDNLVYSSPIARRSEVSTGIGTEAEKGE